jgi:hypothetical protein
MKLPIALVMLAVGACQNAPPAKDVTTGASANVTTGASPKASASSTPPPPSASGASTTVAPK